MPEYDINIYKDRSFNLRVNTTISGMTFKAQIRKSFNSSEVLADFDIEVNESEEYLELKLDSTTTNNLVDDNNIGLGSISTVFTYPWDLKVTNDVGNTFNIINGTCFVNRTVTKGE